MPCQNRAHRSMACHRETRLTPPHHSPARPTLPLLSWAWLTLNGLSSVETSDDKPTKGWPHVRQSYQPTGIDQGVQQQLWTDVLRDGNHQVQFSCPASVTYRPRPGNPGSLNGYPATVDVIPVLSWVT